MINFKVKELLDKNKISRYRLQKMTNWNYKRVNSYYKGDVVEISVNELNQLCELFHCKVSDLIEYVKD